MSYEEIACNGKVVFDSFKLAETMASKQARHTEGMRFKAYKCRHCNKFHVGTDMLKRSRLDISTETPEERRELDWLQKRNTWL